MTSSPNRPPGRRGGDPVARALLAAALLLGLIGFVQLGEWSLWIDEAYSLADSLHRRSIQNPLGYWFFSIFLGFKEGRADEFTLRLLPAIFGWLGIPLAYWAFRPFVGARRAALVALILAVSPWHLFWSQNARFYTLTQDLSLLGAGLCLRGLARGHLPRIAAGLLLAAAAGLAHPSAVFLAGALVLAPLLISASPLPDFAGERRALRALLWVGALGFVLGAAWAWEIWVHWGEKKGTGSPLLFLLSTGFFVTPVLGTGALLGAWTALRRRDPFGLLVVAVLLLAVGGILLASLFARVNAQYVFSSLPWIAVLAVLPLSWGDEEPRPEKRGLRLGPLYLVLLVLPALADDALYFGVQEGLRPRWRDAYEHVIVHREPTDLVVGMEAPVGEYYLAPQRTDLRDLRHVLALDEHQRGRSALEWANRPRRTWFVVNFELFDDLPAGLRDSVLETLRTDCRLDASFRVRFSARDLDVFVFLRE